MSADVARDSGADEPRGRKIGCAVLVIVVILLLIILIALFWRSAWWTEAGAPLPRGTYRDTPVRRFVHSALTDVRRAPQDAPATVQTALLPRDLALVNTAGPGDDMPPV